VTCPSNLSSQEMELCSCIPNSSYRVDIKGAGYDTEPGPEPAVEIIIFESPTHRATPTRDVNQMQFQSSNLIRNRQVPANGWTGWVIGG